jgi:hypothetical protein
MGRRVFTTDFKHEAVKLVLERGVSKSQAARDQGLHVNVLRGWIKDIWTSEGWLYFAVDGVRRIGGSSTGAFHCGAVDIACRCPVWSHLVTDHRSGLFCSN